MILKRINNVRELDTLLPLLKNGCCMTNSSYSFMGFIGYLAMAVASQNCLIIVAYEEDKPMGYVIAQITAHYYELECDILDLNIDNIEDMEVKQDAFEEIIEWAQEKKAKRIIARTPLPDIMERYFGFTNTKLCYIIKEI